MAQERLTQGNMASEENKLKETTESERERDNIDTVTEDRMLFDYDSDSGSDVTDDYTKWDLFSLLLTIETSKDPERLEACQDELDRRYKSYDAWKAKYGKEEESDDSVFPRPKIVKRDIDAFTTIIFAGGWECFFEYEKGLESEC